MRQLVVLAVLAIAVSACTGAAPTIAPATTAPTAAPATAAQPTAAATRPAITPPPSQSFKAGEWPPEWQLWICSARAQMLRDDAKAGGTAGEDAATQALADLHKTTLNWQPGADLRALIGKAAFILLDAAPRKTGNAMADVPPAIKAFETAYQELKGSTGFECP
jgi:hypothetical protein